MLTCFNGLYHKESFKMHTILPNLYGDIVEAECVQHFLKENLTEITCYVKNKRVCLKTKN